MKIRINYDLLDKIKDSKTGFLLKRTTKKCVLATSISCGVGALCRLDFSQYFPIYLILDIMVNFPYDYYVLSKDYKLRAIKELKYVSSLLREQCVNTDYELLQDAYSYDVNYSFILDEDKIPRLKQEKYIKVPVVDRDGEKEVSIVQEHLIGSNEYELSYGSPKKVLKPAYNLN